MLCTIHPFYFLVNSTFDIRLYAFFILSYSFLL